MSNSLKKETGRAIFWSFLDKGGQQIIQLVFGVILARILFPNEIGVFAMLAIFTSVANILQESGFSAALIRKKEPSDKDFSSVFIFNISVSILIYLILFFLAPLISQFYENPILTDLSRVVFLSFVFNSFGITQNVMLIRKMDFKTNTKITLIASLLAGIVAIALAINGYGVWSLAAQLVLQTLLRSILLWLFVKWIPKTGFYVSHIRAIMPYSMKLLATSVMNQVCSNLYTNIIGKYFSIHQAGVYSQGYKYGLLPQTVIGDGIKTAVFPALTRIDNDLEYTKKAFRKIVRITAFIAFPIAVLSIVIAKPAILLLITEKWIDAIPILQIVAIGASFYPLYSLVSTLLQAVGKTGLLFKLETFRNILALSLILLTIKYGVHGIVAGMSFVAVSTFFFSIYIAGKEINYRFTEIIKDVVPYILIAIISISPLYFLEAIGVNNLYALLFIPSVVGIVIYLGILKIAGAVILDDSIDFFRQMIKKGQDD